LRARSGRPTSGANGEPPTLTTFSSREETAMSPRRVLVALAALALVAPAGCRAKTAPSASAAWVPPAPTDYRQYGLIELQELVRGKMGAEAVTMKADGPNHYSG